MLTKTVTLKRTVTANCGKCAGDHSTRTCTSNEVKCINCIGYSIEETHHMSMLETVSQWCQRGG